MTNNTDLLRIIYFSRNAISSGVEDLKLELNQILAVSQKRNAMANVSGVLIFNEGVFGQVLEGPIHAVEETFDRIQTDERHFDITVIETQRVAERSFETWSMGYIGADKVAPRFYKEMGVHGQIDLEALNADKVMQLLDSLAIENEVIADAA